MVERSVTRGGVCIVVSTTHAAKVWFGPIEAACARHGLSLIDRLNIDTPPVQLGEREVLLISDAVKARAFRPREYWIIHDYASLEAQIRVDDGNYEPVRGALRLIFAQLCQLNALAGEGWPVVDGSRSALDIGPLGKIERDGSVKDQSSPPWHDNPLAIFARLPVEPSTSAPLPLSGFSYTVGQLPEGGDSDIDLSGRGRIVMHGPYLSLPAGQWAVEINTEIDPESGTVYLRFEWGFDLDVTAAFYETREAGLYQIKLQHGFSQGSAAQVRIWVQRPTFDGRMRLIDCTLTYLGAKAD